VHNYFPPPEKPFLLNLASQNEENLARSRAHCRAATDLSVQLKGNLYAAHGGFAADLSPDKLGNPLQQATLPADGFPPYERTYATLVESARCLTGYAKERGVRFLIENNVFSSLGGETGRKLVLMVEAEELLHLAQDIHDPNFGLLVDVGHVNVSATALGFDRHRFIDILAPHIVAFHLSDNDGVTDQHLPFGHSAWFLPRLRDFPNATIVIELSNLEIEQVIAVRDTVREWL
jgi:sugar phosphate isomerase/epimerase